MLLLHRLRSRHRRIQVERNAPIRCDVLRKLAHRQHHCAVVVAGLQVRNHRPADIAHLGVVQNPFEPVPLLDAVLVVLDRQQHQHTAVRALLPHLPLAFKLIRIIVDIVAGQVIHGHDGHLRVGLRVIELTADAVEPGDCLG